MNLVFRMKLRLRSLAWSALSYTERWIGMGEIQRAIDEDRFDEARDLIEKGREIWGDDPEFVRASTLVSFLDGH